MNANASVTEVYQHTSRLLAAHETLLADAERHRPFLRALEQTVRAGMSVLDIGSGTGVWAILAARLGARRVVAIERDPLLIGLIQALARDNGVADRVETIAEDSRAVQLGREFDVVLSETIGHFVFDEDVIPILLDARSRFLKPGGVLLPQTVNLRVAAAHLDHHDALPAGLPLDFGRFEALLLNVPVALHHGAALSVLSEPADLVRVNLAELPACPDVHDLGVLWRQQDLKGINCFTVWVEARLAHGIELDTRRGSSWSTVAYRIRPFRAPVGDLAFRLGLDGDTHRWSASAADEMQSYAPARAASALVAAARLGPDALQLFPQVKPGKMDKKIG
jgi:protein arginine N-methyltransferase 1